ncbi:MAG: peptidylprolyl isomerase [Candidatus Wenzhouxiangella sp. M2_3B_020]
MGLGVALAAALVPATILHAQEPESDETVEQDLQIEYESRPVASWAGAILTERDLMAYLEVNVPPHDRQAFFRSPERTERLLRDLMTPRVIATDGIDDGLLDDPVLRAEMYQAAMNFLSEKQFERVADRRELDDYEQQARELYLRDREAHRQPETVDFTHLLVRDDDRDDDPEEPAEDRIRALAAQVEDDGEFEALVVEHSEDPSVERNQGSFDDIPLSDLDPDFAAALETLEPGVVSEPVQTQFGWHLIRLDARNPSEVPPFEEIKGTLIQQARRLHRDEIQERYANSLLGQPLRLDREALNAFIEELGNDTGQNGD